MTARQTLDVGADDVASWVAAWSGGGFAIHAMLLPMQVSAEQLGNVTHVENCGECTGCKIEQMIQSGLAEIDAMFQHRAKQLSSPYLEMPRETEIRLRREWSSARWNFVRDMKPIGCVQPRFVVG